MFIINKLQIQATSEGMRWSMEMCSTLLPFICSLPACMKGMSDNVLEIG